MRRDQNPETDKELWQRLLPAGKGAHQPVSELDFAAFLEGRLPEGRAAEVEAAIADDPEMRRAALELAEILNQPLPAAPTRLEVRARALVGFEVERQRRRLGLFDWLLGSGHRFMVQRVATLAAAVVVAISGFFLGGGLGASMAEERLVTSFDSSAPTTSSNDPTEFLGSDGI
ncbi:MAG: hypothetical protein U1E60_31300 [Reyranellaceae bacterium]